MELVIDRSNWLRGPNTDSCLLNEDGKMCCLGFLALADGMLPEEIRGISVPSLLEDVPSGSYTEKLKLTKSTFATVEKPSSWADSFPHGNDDLKGDAEYVLVGINDGYCKSEEAREQILKEAFQKYLNIDVVFV